MKSTNAIENIIIKNICQNVRCYKDCLIESFRKGALGRLSNCFIGILEIAGETVPAKAGF